MKMIRFELYHNSMNLNRLEELMPFVREDWVFVDEVNKLT
jgi:hypothetical protein